MNERVTHIYPNIFELYAGAAQNLYGAVKTAITKRGQALIVLSGGGTPVGLFVLLRQHPYLDLIPWEKIHVFWADERCVPPTDSQSNYGEAYKLLLSHVPIPEENIHPIDGTLDPKEAAMRYHQTLVDFIAPGDIAPAFDWVLLGMGADGHTASLFPGQTEPFDPLVLAFPVQANYDGRPAERVSLTSNAINYAHQVAFLVTGKQKAPVLKQVLEGARVPRMLPPQRIQPPGGVVTWFIDQDAASLLA
ncbi:MAG: 6-phosphogluconolactonase [Chloroflexi bacterium 44-23]|nr:MAG: 6-phosphogluconolactonase [Chloroflexi bacterium 44-23]